jgi:energy-coupling factor transporter ATP-binding protein EcfA2
MLRNDKRIESVRLVEIGPFADCEMVFQKNKNPNLAEVHIFTGGNGCGKSTVLYCLAAMFAWPVQTQNKPLVDVLKRFHNAKSKILTTQFESNYQLGWGNTPFKADMKQWYGGQGQLYCFSSRDGVNLDHQERVNFIQPSWKQLKFPYLPLAYSGQRPLDNAGSANLAIKELTQSPLQNHLAFGLSVEPAIIAQWMANIEAKEALALKDGDNAKAVYLRISLNAVTRVINEITGDDLKFALDSNTLEVVVKRGNTTLSFDVLPDGLKSIISWIADVLMRMDRLPWENPDAPLLEQPLILFLDEIDIHLHPKWQRKVLPVVQKLFPNAQIFVSTHSPFVVGSVQDAWVYKLDDAKTQTAIEGIPSGAGTSYEVLLEEIFDVSEHYDVETQRLLAEMKSARNALLADKTTSPDAFKAIAHTLAARSEELDGVVATELRQLAMHGRVITLDPTTA